MNLTTEYINEMLSKLPTLKPNQWYNIYGRADSEELTEVLKHLIDTGNSYLFSHDYKMFKREEEVITDFKNTKWKYRDFMTPDCRVEHITRGTVENFSVAIEKKGQQNFSHTFEGSHYRVYCGDKLIAIE